MFIHLFNMGIINSYILNKEFGVTKLSHNGYREYIAEYLVSKALPHATVLPARIPTTSGSEARLFERHFPACIEALPNSIRRNPARQCAACNFTNTQLQKYGCPGAKLRKKFTSYWCSSCQVALCIEPCFEVYHTEENYKHILLGIRVPNFITDV